MAGKVLLITGGTGSFGNTYLTKVIDSNKFSEIRILSRDENKMISEESLIMKK